MAVVTGLTAARMIEIERASIVAGAVDLGGNLQLTNHGGDVFNAGNVRGPEGPKGDPGEDANFNGEALGSGVDLNTLDVPGVYTQSLNANTSLALNYPYNYAGLLEVHSNDAGSRVYQRYTTYLNEWSWIRTRVDGTWGPWKTANPRSPTDDTGTNLPVASGFAPWNATAGPRYHRWGPIVWISGAVSPSTTAMAEGIATNPGEVIITASAIEAAGISPAESVYGAGYGRAQGSGSNSWLTWFEGSEFRGSRYAPGSASTNT